MIAAGAPPAHDGLPWPVVVAITAAVLGLVYEIPRRWDIAMARRRKRGAQRVGAAIQPRGTEPYERPAWAATPGTTGEDPQ